MISLKNTKNIYTLIFGPKNSFNLEQRVFIIASLVGLFSCIVGVIWNSIIGLSLHMNVIIGSYIILYYFLFHFARYKQIYNPFVYALITLSFLSLLYINSGGISGSTPALYIVALVTFISLSKRKHHLLMLLITLANIVILFVLEYTFSDKVITEYNNRTIEELDLAFGYLASSVACFVFISFFKKTLCVSHAQLKKSNENKDLFFNVIAHDLRGPFSHIMSLTEIMADKSAAITLEEFKECSELLNQETKKTYQLLESLLEWGKIQMNKVTINPQKVNLKDVIDEITHFHKENYTKKNINIEIQVANNLYAFADINALRIILRNLISNAIKFTPNNGEIRITVEKSKNKNLLLIVKDSGIGMNKIILDNLFLHEVSTNRKGSNGETSVGLGLIITKELIEKQSGELIIESEENKGSTFKFTIPRSASA
ncbi:sensor histidine kinase [Sunxiuqinia sp. sy24]|uniref:sensor histidine kinase n=1 Tax=Sunxiuqinia sp. sy24 TaxID=3461495 RepID=UPI004045D2FC